jgi:hypothetical protein
VKHPQIRVRTFDRDEARLRFECMEEQKEQLRALLSVLNETIEITEAPPDVKTLLALALHICEGHEHWYRLQECLAIHASKPAEASHA